MENIPNEDKIQQINFYKILFNKHDSLPVGRFSRNLDIKIKDSYNQILTSKEKNMEYFNPISENNIFKIQKLYSQFRRNQSANKFMNKSTRKAMDKILSRPLSQYSTIIDLSKNTHHTNLKKNFSCRPTSPDKGNSNYIFDKFFNNATSIKEKNQFKNLKEMNKKKEDNKNNKFFVKKNLLKKEHLQRNVSAPYIYPKKDLIRQQNVKKLLKHEEEMKEKKKFLKCRLLSALSNNIVINNETFKNYDLLYKNENEEKKNENNINANKNKKNLYDKDFRYTNHNSYCFSQIRPPFRYEDKYYSPMELLQKYFNKEEIIILKSSPAYFGINKFPFKNDVKFNPTLLSKFDVEDNKDNNGNKYNFNLSYQMQKPKKKKINFDLNKEMQKIKNVFKERKIKKKKREPIKGKDFVSHYERDIEPDEGTVAYFDRKYLKYMTNKEKKMEKKINNIKFKKNRFEYLKNLRTQKIQEEKNIQRIVTPYINAIKKNYMRSNSNINI